MRTGAEGLSVETSGAAAAERVPAEMGHRSLPAGRPGTDHSARPRRKKTNLARQGGGAPATVARPDRLYNSDGALPFQIHTGLSEEPKTPTTPGGTVLDPRRPRRKKTGVIYGYITTPPSQAPFASFHAGSEEQQRRASRDAAENAQQVPSAGAGMAGAAEGRVVTQTLTDSMFTMTVRDEADAEANDCCGYGDGGGALAVAEAAEICGSTAAGVDVVDVVTRERHASSPSVAGQPDARRHSGSVSRAHLMTQTKI